MIAAVAIATSFHFDTAVSAFMVQHRNRVVYNFMFNVSRFGDWPGHVALGLILAWVAWRRGNRKWKRIFLSMVIALAIAGISGHVIKIAVSRARPSVKLERWNPGRVSIRITTLFHPATLLRRRRFLAFYSL